MTLFIISFFFSCSEYEEEVEFIDAESAILDEAPECTTSPTDWDGYTLGLGETIDLSLTGSFSSQTWTSSDESVLSFETNTTSSQVTLNAASYGSATICVTANVNNILGTCASCGIITVDECITNPAKCTPPPLPCFCPNPSIELLTCLSTNGFIRLEVEGIESGDDIQWSTTSSNVNLQNGQTSTTLNAYIYDDSDFRISCTVERECSGNTLSRTVHWTSNRANSCQYYGTWSDSCSGIDPIDPIGPVL